MSTSILLRLTLVVKEVRFYRSVLEKIETRDFWKEKRMLPELLKVLL